MKDTDKSKDQLIYELTDLRQRLVNSEKQNEQSEGELQIILEHYDYVRTAIQSSFIGVGSATVSGKIIYANDTALRISGYESLQSLQENNALTLCRKTVDRVRLCKTLQESGTVDNLALDIVTESGEIRSIVLSGFLIKDVFTATLVDVTKLKQAELVLRTNEEHYRKVLSAVSDYAYSMKVEPDKSVSLEWLTGNPEKIIGYTEEDFRSGSIMKFALDVTRPEHRQLLKESYEALMKNERTSTEVLCRRKDGQDVWLRIYRQPIWDDNEQRIVRYYGAVSDITKEKEIEETYREQELLGIELAKEKELHVLRNRYLSTIAHDFRSPLAAIRIASDILNNHISDYTETKRKIYFDRINDGVAYLDNLLQELGLLARAERGHLSFVPELLSPHKVCAEIINDFISINDDNHEIIYNCSTMVEKCYLDENLLRHILTNLLSNAVKYSPKQSRITFDVSDQDKNLIFKVSDEGIGIPDENKPRLFDPFYRADNVGSIKGSGVGLSIVKQMVSIHGGQVDFETRVNIGTTFTVTIPIKHGDSEIS